MLPVGWATCLQGVSSGSFSGAAVCQAGNSKNCQASGGLGPQVSPFWHIPSAQASNKSSLRFKGWENWIYLLMREQSHCKGTCVWHKMGGIIGPSIFTNNQLLCLYVSSVIFWVPAPNNINWHLKKRCWCKSPWKVLFWLETVRLKTKCT